MSQVKEELLTKELLRKVKGNELTDHAGMKVGRNTIIKDDVTLELADVWGFCYGVLYAIEAVGETLEEYPDRDVWVLGDLIHNPYVNGQLEKLGATFIDPTEVDRIGPDDVAVIPAFGTREEIFEELEDRETVTVDTTCPEVREVEEQVHDFNNKGLTAIIHGKHEHQESIATSSFAERYLIVRDPDEAAVVCNYIRNGGNPEQFKDRFREATSDAFDPDRDLREVGLANQTTMLMNESLEVFEMIEQAIEDRDGHTDNVETIDTICSATQDRQDAVNHLINASKFDVFIVVGGFTSSNTKNLARTVQQNGDATVYHIEDAECFDDREITHLPSHSKESVTTDTDWKPAGDCKIGVTAGASTPHSELEDVLKKIISLY